MAPRNFSLSKRALFPSYDSWSLLKIDETTWTLCDVVGVGGELLLMRPQATGIDRSNEIPSGKCRDEPVEGRMRQRSLMVYRVRVHCARGASCNTGGNPPAFVLGRWHSRGTPDRAALDESCRSAVRQAAVTKVLTDGIGSLRFQGCEDSPASGDSETKGHYRN